MGRCPSRRYNFPSELVSRTPSPEWPPLMLDYADAKAVAVRLAAVAEPTRIQILGRLADRPHHVGELADALGVPMVNMSHHLGVLRQAGLLDDEKVGRRVIYRLRAEPVAPADGADARYVLAAGAYRLVVLNTPGAAVPAGKKRAAKATAGG